MSHKSDILPHSLKVQPKIKPSFYFIFLLKDLFSLNPVDEKGGCCIFSPHFDWVQESLIPHLFEALSPPLSLPLQINDVGPQSLISPHHSRKALHVWFKCLRCQWIQLLFVIQCLTAARWHREDLISSRFSVEKHSLKALERLLVGGNACLYGLPYWALQRSCTWLSIISF